MHRVEKHDRFLNRKYLLEVLRRSAEDKLLWPALVRWIRNSQDDLDAIDAGFVLVRFRDLGLDDIDEYKSSTGRRRTRRGRPAHETVSDATRVRTKEFLSWAVEELECSLASPPSESAEAQATALAARRFGLGEVSSSVLELARLCDIQQSPTQCLWDVTRDALGDHLEASSALLGVRRSHVEQAFRELTEVGIAHSESWTRRGCQPDSYVEEWLQRIYSPPVKCELELRERLVPLAPEPLLELGAFDHLNGREEALRLLSAAIAAGESVRLLLYGRAGTGKTEFAKTLVRACGGSLYDLRESESSSVWRGRANGPPHGPCGRRAQPSPDGAGLAQERTGRGDPVRRDRGCALVPGGKSAGKPPTPRGCQRSDPVHR